MTTTLQIAAFYVALNALITFILAANVVRHRARTRIAIGDGGDEKLRIAQRAHGNNIEYVPIMLLMLMLLSLMNASSLAIHIFGGALALGRAMHGYAVARSAEPSTPRAAGAMITWVVMIAMIVYLFMKAFS